MTENDFERVYIYYGCYIYKTEKQLDFKNNLELFFKNIENSNWNLNTMVYIPVDKIIL
jgi:type II restriction/modification system DNA methylase subunit YeeA